ncbi:cytochrome c oxidase subunit 5A, mitochondrial-like [Molossus nigricans]
MADRKRRNSEINGELRHLGRKAQPPRGLLHPTPTRHGSPVSALPLPGSHETEEESEARWVTHFNKPGVDAWELREGMNTLVGSDLVPEPKIIDAALWALQAVKCFASAVRVLEVVKDKAGPRKEIYPHVIQELRPTLNELGISTPEELGLDKV